MSNAPNPTAGQQDFIKGWPNPALLDRADLKKGLADSFYAGLDHIASTLNYGTKEDGAWMRGHPLYLNALAGYLTKAYKRPCDQATLMATGGSSMGTDIVTRCYSAPGDIAVSEAPTYYLAHQMFREHGLQLMEVPLENDGMDVDALERLCERNQGKVKLVYTVPIHHNPTGITMNNEKRAKLMALARKFNFYVIADEAYQLLNFRDTGVVPMFYHDDPSDPRCFSISTFSKIIGPGIKVGWIQAHSKLLPKLCNIGFINSGNNPVTFSSACLAQYITSGALEERVELIGKELGRKCALLCSELRKVGLEPYEPAGGYFVWCKSKGKMTGRSGAGMALDPPDRFANYMRLCFAWLNDDEIVKGVEYLKQE